MLCGKSFFKQKIYGEVILNGKNFDQIMSKWERSFINDKFNYQ